MEKYLNAILNAKMQFQRKHGLPDHLLKVMVHPADYIKLEGEAKPYTTLRVSEDIRPVYGMKVEVREEIQEGRFIITENHFRFNTELDHG